MTISPAQDRLRPQAQPRHGQGSDLRPRDDPAHVFALGVGPVQSMLGLAVKNGHILTPSSEPDLQPVIEDADMKRCAGCGSVRDRRGMDCLPDGSWRCCDCATPSSSGDLVSREVAARALLSGHHEQAIADAAYAAGITQTGFRAALRALAGEGRE